LAILDLAAEAGDSGPGVVRVDLDADAAMAEGFGRDQGGAGAEERIEEHGTFDAV
jgi:hypothetical protein